MSGVAEEVSIDGNGLTLPLISPASVVPEEGRGEERRGEKKKKTTLFKKHNKANYNINYSSIESTRKRFNHVSGHQLINRTFDISNMDINF